VSDPIPLPCTDCAGELLAELVEIEGKWCLRIRRLRKGEWHVGVWDLASLQDRVNSTQGSELAPAEPA